MDDDLKRAQDKRARKAEKRQGEIPVVQAKNDKAGIASICAFLMGINVKLGGGYQVSCSYGPLSQHGVGFSVAALRVSSLGTGTPPFTMFIPEKDINGIDNESSLIDEFVREAKKHYATKTEGGASDTALDSVLKNASNLANRLKKH